jgi:hypothetical protein
MYANTDIPDNLRTCTQHKKVPTSHLLQHVKLPKHVCRLDKSHLTARLLQQHRTTNDITDAYLMTLAQEHITYKYINIEIIFIIVIIIF